MAKAKRPLEAAAVEVEVEAEATESSAAAAEPSKKRPKSEKPMERRKKRKELDKERHRDSTADAPKKSSAAPTASSSSSGSDNALPEFHISVFGDLASSDFSKRVRAAETLVTELEEVQKAYERLGRKEVFEGGVKLEAERDDGLDDCAPSVRYAVRRLVRGVSSSRECARQGFALGLTLLVGAIPTIRVDSLMKLTSSLLEVSSSMKGQEVRDCLLGQLFAYGALARSGRLAKELASDKSTPHVKEFTSQLIALSAKKRYLQEPAVHVILDLVDKLPSDALKGHVVCAPGVQEWFEVAAESGNPDALLLALKIQEKISGDSSPFGKLLPNPFSSSKFFSSEHLSSLMNCLKESTFCQPRVHTVWSALSRILLPDLVLPQEDAATITDSLKKQKKGRKGHPSEEETAKHLRNFVEVVIDGSLMSSSHDRKHLAFDIVLNLIPKLPASLISHVLSYKLVRCLVDVLSTKDSWLYKIAENFLQKLSDWVKDDDVRRVGVVMALQRHSNGKFDVVTRTKTIKNLMAEFETEPGCMLFIQSLTSMFVDEGNVSDEPSDQSQTTDDNSELGSTEDKDSVSSAGNVEYLKSWVIESTPGVLKHLKLEPEAKFRVQKEILKFLAVQGLFTASLGSEVTSFELQEKFRWPKVAASSALCGMCIEQLQSVLASYQKGEGPRASLTSSEQNDLGSFFIRFFCTLRSIPSVSLFRALNDDDKLALEKLQETENMLSREERSSDPSVDVQKFHALRYLLIQLLLQVLLRPGEFSEAASELVICCKKVFSSADAQDSSGEDDVNGVGAPELMDVLVDTLLSLLPQSSASLRSAIEQVFKYFCSEITDDGLRRMIRVIKKDLTPPRHATVGSDDESADEQDEDFLDIEEDEDAEDTDMDKTVENDEITDDSEAAVAVAENNREVTENSDEESDEGMDDEAMFRMDTYLARIFKERKNQTSGIGAETAQSQLVLFKLRVLSLLEIHLHENPGKSQVLTVFSNLAQAYVKLQNAESNGQLGERIWVILQKKVFKAKEYPKGDDLELSTIETLLEKSLKWASKPFKRKTAANPSKKPSASLNHHKMIVSLAQKSTHWLLKILEGRKFEESKLDRVRKIFQGVMAGYFDSKKSQIKPEFLKEILKRRPWIGWGLFGFMLEKCGTTKSEFRRVEALDLILEILKQFNERQLESSIKDNLTPLTHLMMELAKNTPKKQARRADTRKFCSRILSILSELNLRKPFLKQMTPEGVSACESQLGDVFLNFKNNGK